MLQLLFISLINKINWCSLPYLIKLTKSDLYKFSLCRNLTSISTDLWFFMVPILWVTQHPRYPSCSNPWARSSSWPVRKCRFSTRGATAWITFWRLLWSQRIIVYPRYACSSVQTYCAAIGRARYPRAPSRPSTRRIFHP